MEDDDISEFGSQVVNPDMICAYNGLNGDWVLLKGELPFKSSKVRSARWNRKCNLITAVTPAGMREIDCSGDEEKLAVLKFAYYRVSDYGGVAADARWDPAPIRAMKKRYGRR